MMASNDSGGRPAPETRDFFPIRAVNGVLLPGNEFEVNLVEPGIIWWHRRVDWAHGPQVWQLSTTPPEVVLESIKAISDLIDAETRLRDMMRDILARVAETGTLTLQAPVPGASPYEPRKATKKDAIEFTIPGGYVSDTLVTITRPTPTTTKDMLGHQSKMSWRHPRTSSNQQDGDLPPDVVKEAADVLERLADLVVWMRMCLGALPSS